MLGISQKRRIDMSLRINDIAPDFTAETTQGTIHFHEWVGDNWAVLFSHPKDFTPVCTTELGVVAGLEADFAKRGAKVIGLSVDPVENHGKWAKDIEEISGSAINYPIIGDPELKIAKLYDMLAADAGDSCEGRTPADNAPVRTVFVVGPDKRIKLTLAYPMTKWLTRWSAKPVFAGSIPARCSNQINSIQIVVGSQSPGASMPGVA